MTHFWRCMSSQYAHWYLLLVLFALRYTRNLSSTEWWCCTTWKWLEVIFLLVLIYGRNREYKKDFIVHSEKGILDNSLVLRTCDTHERCIQYATLRVLTFKFLNNFLYLLDLHIGSVCEVTLSLSLSLQHTCRWWERCIPNFKILASGIQVLLTDFW